MSLLTHSSSSCLMAHKAASERNLVWENSKVYVKPRRTGEGLSNPSKTSLSVCMNHKSPQSPNAEEINPRTYTMKVVKSITTLLFGNVLSKSVSSVRAFIFGPGPPRSPESKTRSRPSLSLLTQCCLRNEGKLRSTARSNFNQDGVKNHVWSTRRRIKR